MHTAAESTGAHDIASTQEQNRRIIEAMVSASGLRKLPRARLAVEAVEAVVQEAAVDLVLGIGGRSFRLRFSNRDDKTPALEKTPSFNAVHIAGQGDKQLDGPSATTLIWAVQRLSRFDSGKLRFTQPPRVRARGALLPVVKGDDLADRVWKRAIFDRSMETLKAKGVQVPSIVAVVSQACEMNCQFCPTTDRVNIHFQPSGESGQLGDLIYQVRRGRELGATAIDFGSNDALLFPGILDVFRAARDAGYTMVMAQSPGQALADRAFAEAAAESGLTHVALPIYGTTAEVHDAITRKPGTFDGLMKALANLREIGLPHVQLHTIALKSTLPLLEGLIAFCRDELGLPVRVSTLRSNRQGERAVVLDMASFSELKPLIAEHPKLFQAEFPPCLFPRARTKAFLESFPRETPPAPINLYDLGLPDGCEDALVALERKPQYPARCAPCQAKFGCSGVLGHYLDVFGDEELDPFLEIGPYKPFSEEE